jgi:hypothetical protein
MSLWAELRKLASEAEARLKRLYDGIADVSDPAAQGARDRAEVHPRPGPR